METNFYYDDDLIDVVDSMELDSGQSVATLEFSDILVELRVEGDVCVDFDDDTYKTPSQFPDELKDLIHSGKYGNDERVCVNNNNWFEVFIYEKKGTEWIWTGWSDVVNADWENPGDIFNGLMDYGKDYLESLKEE